MEFFNKRINIFQIAGILSIVVSVILQFLYLNPYASTWDQVDFSLALDRFDLMSMQPHFPGYPYFILGGKVVQLFWNTPQEALTIFNIVFYFSSVIPIYFLSRSIVLKEYALFVTALIYTSTYTILMVNQPMSEGSALACMWWLIWSVRCSLQSKKSISIVIPLFLLSLLFGLRLSYLPFLIGIVYLLYSKWKSGELSIRKVIVYTSFAIIFQLIWIGALILTEGSIKGFIKLALAFTSGHFQDWGGSAASSDLSLIERLYYLIGKNFFWVGLSSENIILGILYATAALVQLFYLFTRKRSYDFRFFPILLMLSTYLLWSLMAQNVEKPRHALPIIVLFTFLLFLSLFSKRTSHFVSALCFAILLVQLSLTGILLKLQTEEKPAVLKLAEYVENLREPSIVYTWEETRVLQYLDVSFSHKRLQTYEVFHQDANYYRGKNIFLTGKVVEGFKAQGIDMKGIKKVEQFNSNELFDPVYHQITLYEWIEEN